MFPCLTEKWDNKGTSFEGDPIYINTTSVCVLSPMWDIFSNLHNTSSI